MANPRKKTWKSKISWISNVETLSVQYVSEALNTTNIVFHLKIKIKQKLDNFSTFDIWLKTRSKQRVRMRETDKVENYYSPGVSVSHSHSVLLTNHSRPKGLLTYKVHNWTTHSLILANAFCVIWWYWEVVKKARFMPSVWGRSQTAWLMDF